MHFWCLLLCALLVSLSLMFQLSLIRVSALNDIVYCRLWILSTDRFPNRERASKRERGTPKPCQRKLDGLAVAVETSVDCLSWKFKAPFVSSPVFECLVIIYKFVNLPEIILSCPLVNMLSLSWLRDVILTGQTAGCSVYSYERRMRHILEVLSPFSAVQSHTRKYLRFFKWNLPSLLITTATVV